MAYPSNNINKSKHFTKSSKGGRAGKGRPKFRQGKKCSEQCPAFTRGCPYATVSKTEYGGACALIATEGERSSKIYDFMIGSEENLINTLVVDLSHIEEIASGTSEYLKVWDRKYKLVELKTNNNYEPPSTSLKDQFDRLGEELERIEREAVDKAKEELKAEKR